MNGMYSASQRVDEAGGGRVGAEDQRERDEERQRPAERDLAVVVVPDLRRNERQHGDRQQDAGERDAPTSRRVSTRRTRRPRPRLAQAGPSAGRSRRAPRAASHLTPRPRARRGDRPRRGPAARSRQVPERGSRTRCGRMRRSRSSGLRPARRAGTAIIAGVKRGRVWQGSRLAGVAFGRAAFAGGAFGSSRVWQRRPFAR